MVMTTHLGRKLTDEQLELLEHVRLFRITTRDAVQRFFPGRGPEGTKSFLRRLGANAGKGRALLDRAPLTDSLSYYFLTSRVLAHFGDPTRRPAINDVRELADRWGVLEFCSRNPIARRKLNPDQFSKLFPSLTNIPVSRNYYVDDEDNEAEGRRIGLIHVDRGASISRTVMKLESQLIGNRWEDDAWREDVIRKNRFTISIVCGLQAKVDRLREKLQGLRPEVGFRFEVLPGLLNILERRRDVRS